MEAKAQTARISTAAENIQKLTSITYWGERLASKVLQKAGASESSAEILVAAGSLIHGHYTAGKDALKATSKIEKSKAAYDFTKSITDFTETAIDQRAIKEDEKRSNPSKRSQE